MHRNKFAFCLVLAVLLGLCASLLASDKSARSSADLLLKHKQDLQRIARLLPKEARMSLPPDLWVSEKPQDTSKPMPGTGAISGHVTKAAGGGGILGVRVRAYGHACPYAGGYTTTASDGSYTITNLPPGWYGVYTGNDSVYVDIYWNDKTYLNPDSVQVTSSTTTPNIDFSLRVGGKITGTLTLTGSPLVSAIVEAIDTATNEIYTATATNFSGDSAPFTVKQLPAGTYRLKTYNEVGYIDVYYNNKSTKATADLIAVTEGGTFSGKNFTLSLGGTIQGLVDCFDTTLTDVYVVGYYVPDPEWSSYGFTDEDGNYTMTGLRSGNWKIIAWGDTTYAFQWYWYADSWSSADTVPVTAPGSIVDQNFSLDSGGCVSGHVYDQDSNPDSGCDVMAFDTSFAWSGMKGTQTNASGYYKIAGLQTGSYYVEASDACHLQFYDHKSTMLTANLVSVTRPYEYPGIDFNLASAVEDQGDITGTIPAGFELSQNHPNPFNPVTEIRYTLHRPAEVSVQLYNLLGQKIRTLVNERQMPGSHSVAWDGKNTEGKPVSSGIYFYKVEVNGVSQTKKMVLLK
ncbi:MAG: FlgD immunoglobulin-like domain containing protein [Candidatus Zixiibacteriota bacterium]